MYRYIIAYRSTKTPVAFITEKQLSGRLSHIVSALSERKVELAVAFSHKA